MRIVAHAAADLHGDLHRRTNSPHHFAIHRMSEFRSIEIDEMKPMCPQRFPTLGDGNGIVVENGFLSVIALLERTQCPPRRSIAG